MNTPILIQYVKKRCYILQIAPPPHDVQEGGFSFTVQKHSHFLPLKQYQWPQIFLNEQYCVIVMVVLPLSPLHCRKSNRVMKLKSTLWPSFLLLMSIDSIIISLAGVDRAFPSLSLAILLSTVPVSVLNITEPLCQNVMSVSH